MTSGDIVVTQQGDCAVITIDHEPKMNSITDAMGVALLEATRRLEAADEIGAIVLTGRGERAFSAGHFLGEPIRSQRAFEINYFTAPRLTDKPVIAAVNGVAYGGGLELALNCDFRVASPAARFVAPGVNLGAVPVGGQSSLLPLMLPPAIAMEMLMLARPLSVEDALRWGFVTEVVPAERLLERAFQLAGELAAKPRSAIRGIKRTVSSTLNDGPAAGGRAEAWFSEIARAEGKD